MRLNYSGHSTGKVELLINCNTASNYCCVKKNLEYNKGIPTVLSEELFMKSNLTFGVLSTFAAFLMSGCLVAENTQFFEPVPSACNPFGDGISGLG